MNIKIDSLNKTILKCKKCPRLVNFVKKISTEKRKQNINEIYWGKPVTGFGEIDAKILIIGLAPAAHGGTRTGRAFTGDKPKIEELNNCSKYFDSEIYNLKKLKTIIALGKVAFDNCVKFYKKKYNLKEKIKFIHGKSYLLPGNIKLIACYHPSPRNVNTKLISERMIVDLFKKARKISMN